MEKSAFFQKPLLLGNDVWIGANAVVMRGVQVGDGAVIGGGAVVTHDVSPYEIWAGCPARKIGQRFSDEIIAELMEIQWWNLPDDVIRQSIAYFKGDVTQEVLSEFRQKIRALM